jgi:hypothetical protein
MAALAFPGKWQITYGWRTPEGPFFTYSSDQDPFLAPGQGVQVIRQVKKHGNLGSIFGRDFYWLKDGVWYGSEIFGLWQYLTEPGPKKVIFGQTMGDNDDFGECKSQAHKWVPEGFE